MVYLENIWLSEISIFLKPKWLKNTVRWEVQTFFISSCEWMLSRVNDDWPTCWWEVRRRQPKLMHWSLSLCFAFNVGKTSNYNSSNVQPKLFCVQKNTILVNIFRFERQF